VKPFAIRIWKIEIPSVIVTDSIQFPLIKNDFCKIHIKKDGSYVHTDVKKHTRLMFVLEISRTKHPLNFKNSSSFLTQTYLTKNPKMQKTFGKSDPKDLGG